MKKRNLIHPGGILCWSTAFILAGGAVSLTSCDNSVRTVLDDSSADAEKRVAEVDTVQGQLESGMVENNFQIPKLGYYHAAAHRFYEFPYNQYKEGQYYVNGAWQTEAGPENISSSRPNADELKRIDTSLEEEQKQVAAHPQTYHSGGGGMGMGNMLMMYWLLSGNRGFFSPGPGFTNAAGQAGRWQRDWKEQRRYAGGSGGGSSSFGSYRRASSPSRSTVSSSSSSSSLEHSSPSHSSSSRGGFGSHSSGSSHGS